MSPRRYRKTRRARMAEETRQRILEATVRLHAERGALGASYSMIADEAGVSTQTVYNHFPDLGRLVRGCTAHVYERAPVVDPSVLPRDAPASERLAHLTGAVYRQLDYLSPWLRLGVGESEVIPELGEIFRTQQDMLRDLVAESVAPEYRPTPEFLDAAQALLDYPAFTRFTHTRSTRKAAALATRCVQNLLPALAKPRSGEPT